MGWLTTPLLFLTLPVAFIMMALGIDVGTLIDAFFELLGRFL